MPSGVFRLNASFFLLLLLFFFFFAKHDIELRDSTIVEEAEEGTGRMN